MPGDGYYGDHEFWVPEHPPQPLGEHHFAAYRTADPDYFSTLQIPLVRGRFFSENERLEHDKYAIVNQEFVRQFFPAEDPIGKHLRVAWRTQQGENYEIIGVVGDTSYQIDRPARPMMWFPILAGIPGNSGDSVLVVRSAKDVMALATPIQKMIASLDPDLPVKNILTMEQIVGESTANSSFTATLGIEFRGIVSAAGRSWALWCAVVSGYPANAGDRHSHGARCRARAGAAPDAPGRTAAGAGRACP